MRDFRPGDRVRLVAPNPILALRSDRGTLVEIEARTGYWLVRLDAEADYIDAVTGETRHLTTIREHVDNLVHEEPARAT